MIQLSHIATTTRAADAISFNVSQAIASAYNEKDVAKCEGRDTKMALAKETKSDKFMCMFSSCAQLYDQL